MSEMRGIAIKRPLVLHDKALQEMIEAGEAALPNETGGILFPEPLGSSWIDVMKINNAPDPTTGMHFSKVEIVDSCLRYVKSDDDWADLTIWHTHPGGGIGPSRSDMRHRIPEMGNLIIALLGDGVGIPNWY
jgi:proteasome lid subunit RPN8/RPN11